jgi:hypothetical protein
MSILLILVSCASIPKATSTLSRAVLDQSAAMHQLNIQLVEQLFTEKKTRLQHYINTVYTPTAVKNYITLIPDGTDYKTALPNIVSSIIPVIERKKDSLTALLTQRENNIIRKLNANYAKFVQAGNSLQNVLDTANELNRSEQYLLTSVDSLTGVRINTEAIRKDLDQVLTKTSGLFGKLTPYENLLKK